MIHARIAALDATSGRWETPLSDQPNVRTRVIDLQNGCQAHITTPFSGVNRNEPTPGSHAMAVQWAIKSAARLPNITDLYIDDSGKVLSFEWSSDRVEIVSMTAGPWEEAFGLPARNWTGSAPESLRQAWARSSSGQRPGAPIIRP